MDLRSKGNLLDLRNCKLYIVYYYKEYRYMSAESKVRIYKTRVRLVMTYAAETRSDTISTQQLLRTTEMKIIRTIQGKTLRDRVRSEHLRHI